jgi:cell division protein FtsI/penicillin-binding protein 2
MSRVLVGGAALAAVALLAAGAWVALVGLPRAAERAAVATAEEFLAAWSAQDWPAVAARIVPPADTAVDAHRAMVDDLDVEAARYEAAAVEVDGATATVPFDADLELVGFGPLAYAGELALVREEGEWLVDWRPTVLHPDMVGGGRFSRTRRWPARGAILDVAGQPLVAESSIVVVGVEPGRITDTEQVVRALVDAAGADEAAVRALLARTDLRPDWFQPVIELSREAFDAADDALRPVPGILFRETEGRGGPVVASHVVGRTGEVTAEQLEQLGPPYAEGDVVGQFGIERALETRLAGRPALTVEILDADGRTATVVESIEALPGEDVQLTLDPAVQRAADGALAGLGLPAALVAVDIPSGGLRAVANAPAGGFDRALAGRYPPGSTFKVVTSAALLAAGTGADAIVDCPGQASIGGRAFRNAGQLALGPITHREMLARSCNTAYVAAAAALADGAMLDAARAFGFVDTPDTVPVPAFGASFPEPGDVTELAAASIGQGRVEASPAHMASVAAAAATGTWRSPILVVGDEPEERPVPGDAAALADMMRAVVTTGTGTAAEVPGGAPVVGKTGSAEFGTASPPETHAWFIGSRGDVAFAVLVEGGGAGGAVAAPVAAAFLSALGG